MRKIHKPRKGKKYFDGGFRYDEKDLSDWKDGKTNSGLIFEGEFLNGKKWNGKGKEYFANNLVYEGEYLYGNRYR